MLPDIRAIIATVAAAIGLLIGAFGVVATLRVAQESRAGSLHAELAQRGHATAPEPQPIMVVETPGPTLLAKAPAFEPLAPADGQASTSTEWPTGDKEQATQPAGAMAETSPAAAAPAEPAPESVQLAEAIPAVAENSSIVTAEPVSAPPVAPVAVAAMPLVTEMQPPSPAPVLALGGPSPEEIAQAKAQRKAAERARARKAEAEKRKKARAARLARERKLAAQRAAEAQKQQAAASSAQGGFGFPPSSSFNSAPFGSTFGAANPR